MSWWPTTTLPSWALSPRTSRPLRTSRLGLRWSPWSLPIPPFGWASAGSSCAGRRHGRSKAPAGQAVAVTTRTRHAAVARCSPGCGQGRRERFGPGRARRQPRARPPDRASDTAEPRPPTRAASARAGSSGGRSWRPGTRRDVGTGPADGTQPTCGRSRHWPAPPAGGSRRLGSPPPGTSQSGRVRCSRRRRQTRSTCSATSAGRRRSRGGRRR